MSRYWLNLGVTDIRCDVINLSKTRFRKALHLFAARPVMGTQITLVKGSLANTMLYGRRSDFPQPEDALALYQF